MKALFFTALFSCICWISNFSQFELIPTSTNAELWEVDCYNGECFVIGSQHYISKVGQSGENLTLMPVPGPINNYIHSFNRIDTNKAFIVSAYPGLGNGTYNIFKTIDNAETWQLIYQTDVVYPGALVMFDSLEGINGNEYDTLNRSVNGGISWVKELSPVQFFDKWDKHGDSTICTGLAGFRISFDRGRTWQYTSLTEQVVPTSYDIINKDSILNTSYGNGVGAFFTKSIDSGQNWEYIHVPIFPMKVKFLSGETIFIVGKISIFDEFGNETEHGAIIKSMDFGNTWSLFDTELITNFLDIEFTNDSIALISGTNGVLIKYNFRDHHLGFEPIYLSESQVNLFPNPTTGLQELHIQAAVNTPVQIKLLDITGKELGILFQGEIHESQKIQVDLSAYPSGIYLLAVQMGEQIRVLKSRKL